MAGVGDLAGGDLQGGEQAGRTVSEVVMGLLGWQPRTQWQDRCGPVQRLDLGLLILSRVGCYAEVGVVGLVVSGSQPLGLEVQFGIILTAG